MEYKVIDGIITVSNDGKEFYNVDSLPNDIDENIRFYSYDGSKFVLDEESMELTKKIYRKNYTIFKMSAACNAAIISGIDVALNNGNTYHYSLTIEDQINLMNLQSMIVSGAEAVPYHADGEECRFYDAADFTLIVQAATAWKLYHESYFNSLRGYIQSLETDEEFDTITYGMEIPEEYQTDVLKQLIAQN